MSHGRNPHQSPCMIPVNHSPAGLLAPSDGSASPRALAQNRRRRALRLGTGPGGKAPGPRMISSCAPSTPFMGGEISHDRQSGMRIADDQNSLRAGSPRPYAVGDFILREGAADHGHPEGMVRARRSPHGYFQPYKDLSDITKPRFCVRSAKVPRSLFAFRQYGAAQGLRDTVRVRYPRFCDPFLPPKEGIFVSC